MFTGIITDIGTIREAEQRGDLRLVIGSAYDMESVAIGASIACSGACLTVVEKGADWFAVDLSAETVARTAPGLWVEGGRLNLERALKVGDELGGHIVTGHVDDVGHLVSATSEGDSTRLVIAAPSTLAAALAAKGSITLDGISLTVNSVEDQADGSVHFGLNIIPHTAAETTLDALPQGRAFNLEIDVLARYLDRMMSLRTRAM
ncbi:MULTISPECIES: riboflavin synthase [unclassified Sphingobium]|uniref:riboflavin synthase n=1 Tax=unclassified Sphingobium TaxID=2611147 RepID=UPI000D15E9B5|nr:MULTISPECIES: riboflavin synthase [unclassified Sphingobium]MBG6117941.1 riboflavin synthase [Sphingobium sp. JAI105]PSO12239.1 riboflavin synthase [Sphingobium sp. AEW4]TWD08584.1 riboflavin synthase alpha chain [Sphingobium sp. AEW010]TWD25784.1 riboflavin synthase alpha chain [Sphingobium sp. AEW013]TWD28380.1 riboflavin synthase alpha chain [Sphingobium sp. AEW001]